MENEFKILRNLPVVRSWQAQVGNPSTGHPLSIEVDEFEGGLSLVKVVDPTKGNADNPTGQDHAVTGIVEGKHLSDRTGPEARQFFDGVRALIQGKPMQGVRIVPLSEL